jgi:hypothetical protein
MIRLTRWAALLGLWLVVACGPKPAARTPMKPEPLRPPAALRYDFMWRQRVTATWPSGKQSFEAVLQKRDGELSMLGLSALGLPGFVLTLRADGSLDVQNRMGRELPFEPSYILADVERVFFPWLAQVAPGFSGEQTGQAYGFSVRERYANGRLLLREFERSADPAAGKVHIDYRFTPSGDAPLHVTLANGFYRYGLEIETLEQSRL